jgi:AcrR family transcriptional regulator
MGSTERRARERDDIRRRILDAARELFAREGYEAVTMRRVAERIEYTPPAIYFHFKDKLELVQALCEEDFAALAATFSTLEDVGDPWERLGQMGRAYVEFAHENPNHYRLLFMTKLPPELGPPSGPEGTPDQTGAGCTPACVAYAMVRSLAEEAITKGSLTPAYADPDLVAQVLWSALHGVASLSITMGDTKGIDMRPTPALTDAMIDTLMRGMAAPDAAARPQAGKPAARTPLPALVPTRPAKKPSPAKPRR